MPTRFEGLLAISAMILLSFVFQIQLKLLANEIAPLIARTDIDLSSKSWTIGRALISWRPLVIAMLAATLFILWFLALTRLDLSVALPVASLALVVNAIGSGLLLGESMGLARIAGVLLVAFGLVLVLKS